ncbi:hypothetical protein LSAT2_027482 [Lamellibrachia satsuma]|nr:hypothetical protein LSAT2_027482 [Lamellibrachia satsuma]
MLQIECDVDEYLPPVCAELDVHLTKGDQHLNMRPLLRLPLLRLICQRFFGKFAARLSVLPSPAGSKTRCPAFICWSKTQCPAFTAGSKTQCPAFTCWQQDSVSCLHLLAARLSVLPSPAGSKTQCPAFTCWQQDSVSCLHLLAARLSVDHTYTGPVDTELNEVMFECDPDGPLMVHTTQLYPIEDATSFHVFGCVISGTLYANPKIRILGENFSLQKEEDSQHGQVDRLGIGEAR